MASSQKFINAYKISSLTAGAGTSFNITVQTNGAKTNVTITDAAGIGDNTAILGDIGLPTIATPTLGDAVTATGLNNTNGTYYFGAAVVGGVTGMVVYDQQGRNYWFIANATIADNATGSGTIASPVGQPWTLAGTAVPSAPAITGITDDAAPNTGNVANGGTTNDTTPTITGTAGAGELITVKDGATTLGTTTANAAGAWSFTTAAQSQATHSYTATAASGAGTSSASAAYTATVDTTAPSAPTVGSALDDAGTVTGTVLSGGVTDDTTPTLVVTLPGNAVAGDTVSILNGAAPVGSRVLVAADITAGKVSITTSAVTGDGAKTLTATVTDAAGNASGAGSFAYTLDTTAPTATTTIALVSDTGTAGDGITSNPALAGKSSVAAAGQTVTIMDGATVVGTATATAAADGSWSFANAGASQSAHSYTAAVTDAAGNSGTATATAPASTTVDTTAPTATTTIALAHDTGAAGDGISSDPSLSGTASDGQAGQTVTIKDGGTVVGTAVTGAGGAWSFANASAGEGAHSYTAAVTDAAGNSGTATATTPAGSTVDTTAPATAATIALAADTGTAGDGITSAPALAGTGPADATIVIKDGGTVVGTTVADGSGAWSFANAGALDGAHSWTAQVADVAGNLGPASGAVSATLDRAADADVSVRLVDAAAGAGGASVSLDLSGLDAGSTAEVTFTGAGGGSTTHSYTANGAATADVSGLLGDVSASVHVVDAAGNAAAGQGGTLAADPVCFYPGTLVATPAGEVPVETLAAGDLVLTADGRSAPVRWLGRQTVSTRFADPLRVLPVRIMAGALGEHLPRRDLLVSADHALLLDGVLVQAGALANGSTIRREAGVPEVFTYWHVELADHALVLAEGVPAESFIDNVARLAFDNWAEHEAAAAPAPIAEMELPRAKAHRQVPSATRARLAERAAVLAGAAAA